jgi:hypothetical protein
MKMFDPRTKHVSPEHARLYAAYELLFTIVDFSAAFLFIVGSILFFNENTTYTGTWLFLIGSVFFGLKPCIRLFREWRLLQASEIETLAERARE